MAMKKAAEKMHGPLSDEIIKSMDDISKGKEREESLRGMVARTKVDDLAQFVSAVIQAEQLGSNIANVLRVQSNSMRQVRRQRAQEKAAKIPVKMLFPMIFFILPSLFVVILGPAFINIMNTLGGML
jgi:tight adherence protein C